MWRWLVRVLPHRKKAIVLNLLIYCINFTLDIFDILENLTLMKDSIISNLWEVVDMVTHQLRVSSTRNSFLSLDLDRKLENPEELWSSLRKALYLQLSGENKWITEAYLLVSWVQGTTIQVFWVLRHPMLNCIIQLLRHCGIIYN